MFKSLAAVCVTLCATGCSSVSTRVEHFKFYVKQDDMQKFVVTNDKNPREPYAVVVRPHETKFVYSLHF